MLTDTQTQRVLVIGALGQIGSELTEALIGQYGATNVWASDIREESLWGENVQYAALDVTNKENLFRLINDNQIDTVYHLAAVLSAKGEQNPEWAWRLNMDGLLNVLEAARHTSLKKIFWPSSIAVFGPDSPRDLTPQNCIMNPNTVYGISKLAGERWCEYYANKFGVDVRSIRYPGLISYKSAPGGGTTDYAIHIFHSAAKGETYNCFLKEDSALPMMYMSDAIRATLEIMQAPAANIKVRSSYNLAGISFTPKLIHQEIQKHLPNFQISYEPDFRQAIADSWPASISDEVAQADWGWKHKYGLSEMTEDMLLHIGKQYNNLEIPVL